MTTRRFPPPWSVEETDAAASSSADPNGQPLAYVYSRRNGGNGAPLGMTPVSNRR